MKHLPGADPELVLLNHRYEELEVSAATRAPVCRCRAPGLGLKRLQSLSLCRESP